MSKTTIQIKKSTAKKLVEFKTYNIKQDTYDDVLMRLISFYEVFYEENIVEKKTD